MKNNKSKKIAKNTLFMYFRMLFLLFISLFTVRIVLKNLGVEDYGIYNLIAGVVVLFNFISNSSSASTSRYLNYALGEKNLTKAKSIYSCSFIIHFFIALLVVILLETIGLWLLNNYLVIPKERLTIANYVFQFSVLTTAINIINIPNNASIIANEKMSFYAIVSIVEGIIKLFIAYILVVEKGDKLFTYGLLIAITSVIIFTINLIYVRTKFEMCRFYLTTDKELYKDLISFSGWSLFSSIGSTCSNQVLTMIINKFFGVTANAAMGIANQVNNTVYQFVSNFQIAFEPQIIKSYAANDFQYLKTLIFRTSKFSLFLLWFIILPLSLNADFVLKVWLTVVPDFAVIFLKIILIYSLIDAVTGPLWMVSYAIGNIRNYQLVAFFMSIFTIPVSWILLKFGFPPYWVIIIRVMNNFLFSIWRLGYLNKRMRFPVIDFIKEVIVKSFFIIICSYMLTLLLHYYTKGIIQFFLTCSFSVIINLLLMWYVGCTQTEKAYIKLLVSKFFRRSK